MKKEYRYNILLYVLLSVTIISGSVLLGYLYGGILWIGIALFIFLAYGIFYLMYYDPRPKKIIITDLYIGLIYNKRRGEQKIKWEEIHKLYYYKKGVFSQKIIIDSSYFRYSVDGDLIDFKDCCKEIYFHVKVANKKKNKDVIIDPWFFEQFEKIK